MSGDALRTLAVAMRTEDGAAAGRRSAVGAGSAAMGKQSTMGGGSPGVKEENLVFLGMVGTRDPARPEAARAVAVILGQGIESAMNEFNTKKKVEE